MSNTFLNRLLVFAITGLVLAACSKPAEPPKEEAGLEFRAPAYPLITIDPYTSAWSTSDQLFDSPVKHWTGKNHSLIGAVRVDGKTYRFLGKEEIPLQPVLANAKYEAWDGTYVNEAPAAGWEQPEFNDASWKSGKGGFGTPNTYHVKTDWSTREIWVRREFTLSDLGSGKLYLNYSHDDDFELYINGKEVVNTGNRAKQNITIALDKSLLNVNGKNVIAAHCLDRGGLAYVDFGIFKDSERKPVFGQVAQQTGVKMTATQTKYSFTCGPVDLLVEFVSPLVIDDLDLLSRPVNYINYQVVANDGQSHDVKVYLEATPEWAVNELNQEVTINSGKVGNVNFLKTGTTEQSVLGKKGDDVRIDWGHFYLASEQSASKTFAFGDFSEVKKIFSETGEIQPSGSETKAVMAQSMPVLAFTDDLESVSSSPVSGYVMLAYDDIESIQYFGDNLKAWWTKDGQVSFDQALTSAATGHDQTMTTCDELDAKIYQDARQAGGENYARLCVLSYRQSIAAHKLVKDTKGEILFLSKENFSNGSIGTVDVTYPSAPLFLAYNPELLKGMLNPIFYYSESGRWTKPFAAHDVGTYPQANGQTYGGDMPVEESGNMLILATAIANAEGNAKYAEQHWDVLTTWANYLLENGLDPENQLCTDDFAGHFAHNVNLSAKAIMGIAGYGKLAEMLGKKEIAEKYTAQARQMAQEWIKMADDGDHFKLTFDKEGTWSQKYNLVWDKLLNLGIFPAEVAQKEIAYYLTKQNEYGLPLDNRRTYTKADWVIWTATLANDQATFQKFIDPVYDYVTETPDRVPMSDWYETPNAHQVGFQARSVVGGTFIKVLDK
ncbi:glutaminase domain-containing protein [Marinoscillum luteum]|uniref:Glutaminase domain-containing protein n=1 Tax=Marinoscillum luteum TaxID=861051 RepID=A0ABW7NAI3_9BACT